MKIQQRVIILILLISVFDSVKGQSFFVNDTIIIQLRQKTELIDTNNIDAVNVNDIRLDESEVKLNELHYKLKVGKLDFRNPKTEIEYYKLFKKVERLRNTINRQNSWLDKIYFNRGVSLIEANDNINGKKYIIKSLEVNPLNVNALYRLAIIYKQEGDLEKASDMVTTILNKTYPPFDEFYKYLKLANSLIDDFTGRVKQYIAEEKFSNAGDLLETATRFCQSNQKLSCNDILFKLHVDTKYGLYKSYTDIAESAIKLKHTDIAETFVFSALTFKKQNMQYLSDRMDAEKILNNIIDIYLEKAGKNVTAGSYVKAMEYFGKANKLCDSTGREDCHDRIKLGMSSIKVNIYNEFVTKASDYINKGQTAIAQDYLNKASMYKNANRGAIIDSSLTASVMQRMNKLKYKSLLKDAKAYYEKGSYAKVLNTIDEAEELKKKYGITEINFDDTIASSSAKKIIIGKINSCDIKIWGNELSEVNEILKSSEEMQLKYLLKDDAAINNLLSIQKERIQKKVCENYREHYELMLYKAKSFIQKNEYAEAEKYYIEAIKPSGENKNCYLNADNANALLKKYEKPIIYQKLIEEAEDLYFAKDYKDFLEKYNSAESYYLINQINTYGLKHILLYDHIVHRDNDELLQAGVSFYAGKHDIKHAINLLAQLKSHGYTSAQTKKIQMEAGEMLAAVSKIDKTKYENQKNDYQYIFKDKWYCWMKESFNSFLRHGQHKVE